MGLGLLIALAVSDPVVDLSGAVVQLAEGRGHPELAAFSEHAAVRGWRERKAPAQFAAQYALYFDEKLEQRWAPPELFKPLFGWEKDLAAFARDSDFFAWRAAKPELTEAPRKAAEALLAARDHEAPLVDYLGLKPWREWRVVVSSFHPPGASWIVEEVPGLPLVVAVAPPLDDAESFAAAIWSEPVYAALYIVYDVCGGGDEPRGRAADAIVVRLKGRRLKTAEARRLRRYEKGRKRWPDIVSFREELTGAPCPMPVPERMQEDIYRRRVSWYEEARR